MKISTRAPNQGQRKNRQTSAKIRLWLIRACWRMFVPYPSPRQLSTQNLISWLSNSTANSSQNCKTKKPHNSGQHAISRPFSCLTQLVWKWASRFWTQLSWKLVLRNKRISQTLQLFLKREEYATLDWSGFFSWPGTRQRNIRWTVGVSVLDESSTGEERKLSIPRPGSNLYCPLHSSGLLHFL